jgi:hypothetical protein
MIRPKKVAARRKDALIQGEAMSDASSLSPTTHIAREPSYRRIGIGSIESAGIQQLIEYST